MRLRPNVWGGVHRADGQAMSGSGAIIFAMRLLLLARLNTLAARDAYHTVVMTRSDHLYACAHPPVHPAMHEVVVPSGSDWCGVTDRHTAFRFASRSAVLGVLPWLAAHDAEGAGMANPEMVLKSFFADTGIAVRRAPRVMFVVRGDNDTSRWSSWGRFPGCMPGLQLKYQEEYWRAALACAAQPCAHAQGKRTAEHWQALISKHDKTVAGYWPKQCEASDPRAVHPVFAPRAAATPKAAAVTRPSPLSRGTMLSPVEVRSLPRDERLGSAMLAPFVADNASVWPEMGAAEMGQYWPRAFERGIRLAFGLCDGGANGRLSVRVPALQRAKQGMDTLYAGWLRRAAATMPPRVCRPFAVCWDGSDGVRAGRSSAPYRRAPVRSKRWHGCFSSSRAPRAHAGAWYNFHSIFRDHGGDRTRSKPRTRSSLSSRSLAASKRLTTYLVTAGCPDATEDLVPFENRSALPIWRGRLHAGNEARAALVNFSASHPELLDARGLGPQPKNWAALQSESIYIPHASLCREHQVVVVVEGFGAAFRLADHLAAGQVVLLHTQLGEGDEGFDEWFYPLLRAWKDIVPYWSTNDLHRALKRLERKPALRREIGANARAFYMHVVHDKVAAGRSLISQLAERQRNLDVAAIAALTGANGSSPLADPWAAVTCGEGASPPTSRHGKLDWPSVMSAVSG